MAADESPKRTIDEAALLLTSLRGLPFQVPRDLDWQALLDLASAHGVLFLVHQSFVRNDIEVSGLFSVAAHKHKEIAYKYTSELKSLLQLFSRHNIATIPLKGPALSELLYGDAAARASVDLDLLVQHKDYSPAEHLLFQQGFTALHEIKHDQRKFLRGGTVVELHFGIVPPQPFSFDLDGVWNRAQRRTFQGVPMLAISDEDLALYLCLHALNHSFSRLIWILDIAHALERLEPDSVQQLAKNAQRQGVELPLLIGCEIVRETLAPRSMQSIETLITQSPVAAGKARHAVEQFFADPETWIYRLRIEFSGSRRWHRRLRLLVPTVHDYAWAERHHLHPGVAPIVRPFRLLQKYGPARIWRILFPRTM